jgi:O-antigen/teichoic acid export membrane protein
MPRGSLSTLPLASFVKGRTARSSAVSIADQMVVSATNFFTGVFLARVCDLHEYGVYVICFSILLLLNSVPGALVTGPMQVLTPVIRDEQANRDYLKGLLFFQMALTTGLATTVWFSIPFLRAWGGSDGEFLEAVGALGVATIFVQGQEFFRRVLFSRLLFARALVNDTAHGVLRIGLLLLLWKYSTADPGSARTWMLNAETVFYSVSLASAIACVLGYVQCRNLLGDGIGSLRSAVSRNWHLGRWTLSDSAVSYSGNQLVVLLVGGMIGMSGAASYEASRLMSGPIQVVQFALANVLSVRVSELFSNSSPQHAIRLAKAATWGGMAIFCLWLVIFWGFSAFIIEVTVGAKYSQELFSMLLFGLFYLVNWISVMQSILANAAMRPEIGFWGTTAGATTSLSLSFLLIPLHGVVAGIVAVTVGQAVSVLVKWLQINSRIRKNPAIAA